MDLQGFRCYKYHNITLFCCWSKYKMTMLLSSFPSSKSLLKNDIADKSFNSESNLINVRRGQPVTLGWLRAGEIDTTNKPQMAARHQPSNLSWKDNTGNVVILIKFSSFWWKFRHFVIMTTSDAGSNEIFVKITFPLQWKRVSLTNKFH